MQELHFDIVRDVGSSSRSVRSATGVGCTIFGCAANWARDKNGNANELLWLISVVSPSVAASRGGNDHTYLSFFTMDLGIMNEYEIRMIEETERTTGMAGLYVHVYRAYVHACLIPHM